MSNGYTAIMGEAVALHQEGRLAEAEARYRQILAMQADDFDVLQNLGIAVGQQGRLADAVAVLRRALALRPDSADALFNLALALQNLGDHGAAIECYGKLLAQGLNSPDVLLNVGNAHLALEHYEPAMEYYHQALARDPACARAINNLGLCLEKIGRLAEADAAYTQASQAAPDYVDPLINLAKIRLHADRSLDAAALLTRALELQPRMTRERQLLAQIYTIAGNIDLAIKERQQAIAWAPERPELYRELILDLNFADGDDGTRVLEACRDWHTRFATPLESRRLHSNPRDPERKLRIGWIGGKQFCSHTLAVTVLPLAEAYDRNRFEWVCYSDLAPNEEDAVTQRFKQLMEWRRTASVPDSALAQMIVEDRIDIVIDPVGFVGNSRLLALARKPAPIHISFPVMGTAGGDTIDYVLSDEWGIPPAAERNFTERVLRMPFGYCYRPPGELPPVAHVPATKAGYVTFGSMNSLPKLSLRLFATWRRILDQVPGARLLIKGGLGFRDTQMRAAFMHRLIDQGVDPARVELRAWTTDGRDHLAVYNEIDIALDSFPYCGVITTYEALSMSVPVIARAGSRVLDRYAAGILATVGFPEGIAASDDEYVARAIDMAADLDRLRSLRLLLRDRLLRSPACDGPAIAATLETALRQAWRDWCTRKSAS